ncbi:Glycosyl transferase family 2 [Tenacibaculum sediminilitoris]|uniref:glycosyltransferase n=1 Tax=Tenacibaculum sediminilitoris TaxID=1820334 RepID=UPI0038940364
MIFTILFYTFVVVTAIQVLYYLFFLTFAYGQNKIKINTDVNIPVSVIVYVKNNADVLIDSIQNLTKQKYSSFEIVLVNNASSDNSLDIIETLQKKHSNIKVVNVENTEAFWGNKKYALTLGVKAATHEHLLFTEINSKALSKNWIHEIASNFSQENTIVIGYQKLKRKKNSFSNLLIRFNHLLRTIQSLSFVKFRNPYNATNHNFAYTKSVFFKVNGYINHLNTFIGEADLFLKDAATTNNTTYSIKLDSFVVSNKHLSFKEWFYSQKQTSILFSLYKLKPRFFLRLFTLTKLLFYLLAIYTTILNWKLSLPFIISYFLIQYVVLGKSASKLHEKNIILLLPFLDICLVLLQISIFISNQISKPTHWK